MDLGGIVVNDANRLVMDKFTVDILGDQGPAGLSGADDHNPLDSRHMGHVAELQQGHPGHAVGKPDTHRTHKAEQESHHHTGTGKGRSVKTKDRHTDHGKHHISPRDAEYLRSADIYPNAAVQLKQGKHQHGDGAPGQNGLQIPVQMPYADLREMEICPEPQSEKKRSRGCDNIQNDNECHLGGGIQPIFQFLRGAHRITHPVFIGR